jgi:ABC-type polysaccharide/polyol phosphate export permease
MSFLITVGATFYPWYKVLAYSKLIALVMLLNPLTYVCEGMRSVLIGGSDYISWWLCLLVLGMCTIVASWWMVYSVRKKLDLI